MNAKEIMAIIRASGKPHYVYILSKPSGEPFYVGVGTWRRILDHLVAAKRTDLDSHKLRVIRKIMAAGGDINYSIHSWFADRNSAERAEVALIAAIGRRCDRAGPLTNVTVGGEGAASPSKAVLSRRSRKLRETWATRDKSKAMAHLSDPEVRARAVASRTGVPRGPNKKKSPPQSLEMRRAKSLRLKANPISRRPDVSAKISLANKGKKFPNHHMKRPESRERISGRNNAMFTPITVMGRTFDTQRQAAVALGVCISTIEAWLNRNKHGARRINTSQ